MSLLAGLKTACASVSVPMFREHHVPGNQQPPYAVFRTGATTTEALHGDGRGLAWLTVGQLSLFVVDDGHDFEAEQALVAAIDGLVLDGSDGYRRARVPDRVRLDDPAGWVHHALTVQARLAT